VLLGGASRARQRTLLFSNLLQDVAAVIDVWCQKKPIDRGMLKHGRYWDQCLPTGASALACWHSDVRETGEAYMEAPSVIHYAFGDYLASLAALTCREAPTDKICKQSICARTLRRKAIQPPGQHTKGARCIPPWAYQPLACTGNTQFDLTSTAAPILSASASLLHCWASRILALCALSRTLFASARAFVHSLCNSQRLSQVAASPLQRLIAASLA
jgi:hypothetical protein